MTKHKNFIILSLCILWTALASSLFAQSFTIQAPESAEAGSPFKVAFELKNASMKSFTPPNFGGLNVLSSAQDQSSFVTISNGRQKMQSTVTMTYILMANKKGTYTIGPASANIGGKVLKTKSTKVMVGGSSKAASSSQPTEMDEGKILTNVGNKNIFVRLILSKNKAYRQQGILATFKLYADPNIGIQQIKDVKFPDYDGFVAQEVDLGPNRTLTTEIINGKRFQSVVLQQWVLLPQTIGPVKVPSATLDLGIAVRQKVKSSGDPMEDFINQIAGGNLVYLDKHLVSAPQTIQVEELPKPTPDGFTGAVGKYSISAEISPKVPKTGESMTVKVTIQGSGNLKLLPNPKLKLPESFDVFDPKAETSIKVTPSGASGRKVIEYYAVPNEVGKATIPSLDLVYFDTETKTYRTASTQPITFNVEKGSGNANLSGSGRMTGKELARIKNLKGSRSSLLGSDFAFGPLYWSLLILMAISGYILFVLTKSRRNMLADVEGLKFRKAAKVAKKRLSKAEHLINNPDKKLFYDEMLDAIWGYFSDKLRLSLGDLTRENIAGRLTSYGYDSNITDEVTELLDQLDFAIYAPSSSDKLSNEELYTKAINLISKIENLKTAVL